MQLHMARLCLDCEEVHDAQQCPVCASETFAAMTRWVPTAERRGRPRPTAPRQAEPYWTFAGGRAPPSRGQQLLKHGALGLPAFGLIGWFLRSTKPGPQPKTRGASDSVEGATPERVSSGVSPPVD